MNKKEIINLVKEFSKMEHFTDCIKEDDDEFGKKREIKLNNEKSDGKFKFKIGTSQFREIANLCKRAECVDEIKLFIKYKISKGNGWNNPVSNNENHKTKDFGEWVVEYIEKIEKSESQNEKEKLVYISEFFGYLFWQAKVTKSFKNCNGRRY